MHRSHFNTFLSSDQSLCTHRQYGYGWVTGKDPPGVGRDKAPFTKCLVATRKTTRLPVQYLTIEE